ncbi:nucleotidyltransferase domain-containing protein [Salisaeta longa]|uniref:nucleotidyltransferase domain-containing protein n=1 Tax=Salisaeta longa TaxID=503170 RepID=UPI0003B72674|nr:nucleotidyltransferase domain-containing protein [Salisaeta longa]
MPNPHARSTLTPAAHAAVHDARAALQDLYGDRLHHLIVFGSQARGEATVSSDVDLAIVLDGPVDAYAESCRTSDVVVDAAIHHGVALSMLHLSAKEFAITEHSLVEKIKAEGITL